MHLQVCTKLYAIQIQQGRDLLHKHPQGAPPMERRLHTEDIGSKWSGTCARKRKCPNRSGRTNHRHVILESGRAKMAPIYPDGLCRAICNGLIEQIEAERKGQLPLAQLHGTNAEAKDIKEQYQTAEEDEIEALE